MLSVLLVVDSSYDHGGEIARADRHARRAIRERHPQAAIRLARTAPAENWHAAVDVLIVDGHGTLGELSVDQLTGAAGRVVAPVLVVGWCWAANPDRLTAVNGLIGSTDAVVVGSAYSTAFSDAAVVFPAVVDCAAEVGTEATALLPLLQERLPSLQLAPLHGSPNDRFWTAWRVQPGSPGD